VNVLVTGATGFAGRHLCRRLLALGHDVVGTTIDAADRAPHPLVVCDVTDGDAVDETVREAGPDAVVHLAAIASVRAANAMAPVAFDTNVRGAQHVLESTIAHAAGATFLAISSAEVYGRVAPADLPLRETQPVAPTHVYGITKAALESLCRAYGDRLRIVILRPFNHIGPGQSAAFVSSSFAKQIADIEAGRVEPVLRVGNLGAQRDFTDVRDMVEAYCLALEHCEPDAPYNICSGKAVAIHTVLEMLLSMTDACVQVEQDPARLRPSDLPVLRGSADRFVQATGWEREYELSQTLSDTLDAWRQAGR
jgi:GDP-4-dehydro-6-deoxy-D-mannose reductase